MDEHVCACLAPLRTSSDWLLAECTNDGGLVRRVTGRELVDRVRALAHAFRRSRAPLCAVYAAGCVDWVVAALAALSAGIAVAPLNARISGPELRRAVAVLTRAGKDPLGLLVADDARLARWRESQEEMPQLVVRINGDGGVPGSAAAWGTGDVGFFPSTAALARHFYDGGAPNVSENRHASDGAAFIIFTSGTTGGAPKAAVLSHAALNAQSRAKLEYAGYTDSDVYLNTAPLHHVGGLSSMLAYLMAGGRQLFMVARPQRNATRHGGGDKFDALAVLRCCREHHVTSIIAVPTMIFDMDRASRDPIALEVTKVLIGGGGLSRKLMRSIRRIFPVAKVMTAYGMTEAASSITFADSNDWEQQQLLVPGMDGNYVGRPAKHFDIRIAQTSPSHPSNGDAVGAHGRAGEIEIRGVSVMSRYLNEDRESLSTSRRQGQWFATGDIGVVLDDGRVFLMGRKKDVIRVGSENVHASEVEAIVLEMRGVNAAAVVGLPDDRLGEVVAVMVTLEEGWMWLGRGGHEERSASSGGPVDRRAVVSESKLQAHCREAGLAGFKVPKFVVPAPGNSLPLTALGKVVKNEVKGALLSSLRMQRPRL